MRVVISGPRGVRPFHFDDVTTIRGLCMRLSRMVSEHYGFASGSVLLADRIPLLALSGGLGFLVQGGMATYHDDRLFVDGIEPLCLSSFGPNTKWRLSWRPARQLRASL